MPPMSVDWLYPERVVWRASMRSPQPLEFEDRFQTHARLGAAVGFWRARRVGLGRGQTGSGTDTQTRAEAVVGPGFDITPFRFATDGLIQIEVQAPATIPVEPQTTTLRRAGFRCVPLGRGGFGQGHGRQSAARSLSALRHGFARDANQRHRSDKSCQDNTEPHFQPFEPRRSRQSRFPNRRFRREQLRLDTAAPPGQRNVVFQCRFRKTRAVSCVSSVTGFGGCGAISGRDRSHRPFPALSSPLLGVL